MTDEQHTNPEKLRVNLEDLEEDESDIESLPELEDKILPNEPSVSKTKYDLNDLSIKDENGEEGRIHVDEEGYEDVLGSGRLKRKIIEKDTTNSTSRPHTGDHCIVEISAKSFQNEILLPFQTVEFSLSEGEVVKTLDLIVPLMTAGEVDEVISESDLAYGDIGLEPDIPPKITLTFKIKLLSFQTPPSEILSLNISDRQKIGKRKKERGNFWYSRGNHTQAIQCYRKAAEYFDDEKIDLEVPADRYLLSRELQEIIEDRVKIFNNLAQAQMKIEAFDSALASLRQVLNMEPNNEKALYRKAKIMMAKGKDDEAVGLLKRVTRLYESNSQAKIDLNRLMNQRKKNKTDAQKLSKKMLGLDKYENENKQRRWKKIILGGLSTVIGISAIAAYKYAF